MASQLKVKPAELKEIQTCELVDVVTLPGKVDGLVWVVESKERGVLDEEEPKTAVGWRTLCRHRLYGLACDSGGRRP